MAGLIPAIHVFCAWHNSQDVDARHEAGHDERGVRDRVEKQVARVN
jgi:hypothetical protein